ncbi:MAG TPA: general stress protein [Cytophagales bacterium]|nr:general stress protein [Cytophagales bacterium]HAP58768.1 general stress protein [Cytophagales bacterium]
MSSPILIAECCQNHNGDREILKRMIHAAAENGADYVKIQAIRSGELTHRARFDEGVEENGEVKVIKRPFAAEQARLAKLDLSLDDEAWFVEECWRAGVGPMTTAFTRTGAREVKDLGYEAIKVASYDCASYPLLAELAEYWSKLFVSTGATYDNEIANAAKVLEGTDVTFLHCVTIYPTPLSDLHLRRISFLRQFSPQVGYSDHSKPKETQLKASKLALALGASCVERHFTILEDDQTKDGPVSVTPSMLAELREFADLSRRDRMQSIQEEYPEWEEALGNATRPLSHAEKLNRDYYRGRFASLAEGQFIYNWEDVDF